MRRKHRNIIEYKVCMNRSTERLGLTGPVWVGSVKKLTWTGIGSRVNQMVYALPSSALGAPGRRQRHTTRMRSTEIGSGHTYGPMGPYGHGATPDLGGFGDHSDHSDLLTARFGDHSDLLKWKLIRFITLEIKDA